jgi:hypothetical protein
MSSLLKSIALFIAIIVALLALPLLFHSDDGGRNEVPAEGLPWQIDVLPDGATRVFGLTPGRSTLEDARKLLGGDVQVALVVAPGESGAVEAYYESFTAGRVMGKMVLTLDTTLAQREQMLKRARKVDFMESTTRRVSLSDEDLAQASTFAITAIAFIPSANLDEQIILQRFGVPAERIRISEEREHFLYPGKGLDLQLDSKGKELLQYVAPQNFAQLRDPLLRKPAD